MLSWFTWSSPGLFENVTVLRYYIIIINSFCFDCWTMEYSHGTLHLGGSLVQNASIVTV